MKSIFFYFILLFGIIGSGTTIQPIVPISPDQPLAVENRAVLVTFLGGFTGFDPDAYRVVRASMASLLVEGVVDHFITTSWGHEGGNEFCVQLNPDPIFTLDRITNMLDVIHPGHQTAYEYKVQPTCL